MVDDDGSEVNARRDADDPVPDPAPDQPDPGTPAEDAVDAAGADNRADTADSAETAELGATTEGAETAELDATDSASTTEIQPRVVGPTGTTVMPTVAEPPGGPPAHPVWSARAQVPTPVEPEEPAGYGDEYGHPDGEDYEGRDTGGEPAPGRLTPALIAVCVALLLAAIGLGGWLIARGLGGGTPPPVPPATVPPATTAPVTTRATAPTSTAPAGVTIANLAGQDYQVAAGALAGQGLRSARSDEASAAVPAGKVIRTDPAAGSTVPAGTVVIVYVSTGHPSPVVTTTHGPRPS